MNCLQQKTGRDCYVLVARQRGFTLIELVIVIVITLSITAMAIPLLAPSRENRRIAESARIVTSMLSQARARAIEIGRPVGVTFERFPYVNDQLYSNGTAAITLSYAEVPTPYAGSMLDARIVIEGEPFTDNNSNNFYDSGDSLTADWDNSGGYTSGGFITAITLDGRVFDPACILSMVKPGDVLRLNYRGNEYTIGAQNASQLDTNGYFKLLDGTSNPWMLISATARVMPRTPYGDYDEDHRFTPGTDFGGVPFTIERTPQRSALQPQTLPEGMAVDLTAYSSSDPLILLNLNNASALAYAPTNGDITIMFAPAGNIESIRWGAGQKVIPSSPIMLLVGKQAYVPPVPTATMGVYPDPRATVGNISPKAGEPLYNWQDLDARWILINHQTGLVTSNPTASVDATAALDTQMAQSRVIAREGLKKGDR